MQEEAKEWRKGRKEATQEGRKAWRWRHEGMMEWRNEGNVGRTRVNEINEGMNAWASFGDAWGHRACQTAVIRALPWFNTQMHTLLEWYCGFIKFHALCVETASHDVGDMMVGGWAMTICRFLGNLLTKHFLTIPKKGSVRLIRRSSRMMWQGHINRILGQFEPTRLLNHQPKAKNDPAKIEIVSFCA